MEIKELKAKQKSQFASNIIAAKKGHTKSNKSKIDQLVDALVEEIACNIITAAMVPILAVPFIGELTVKTIIVTADAIRVAIGKSKLKDNEKAQNCPALAKFL